MAVPQEFQDFGVPIAQMACQQFQQLRAIGLLQHGVRRQLVPAERRVPPQVARRVAEMQAFNGAVGFVITSNESKRPVSVGIDPVRADGEPVPQLTARADTDLLLEEQRQQTPRAGFLQTDLARQPAHARVKHACMGQQLLAHARIGPIGTDHDVSVERTAVLEAQAHRVVGFEHIALKIGAIVNLLLQAAQQHLAQRDAADGLACMRVVHITR